MAKIAYPRGSPEADQEMGAEVTRDRCCLVPAKNEEKLGSCNHKAGHIRLNTELVKKPKDLLEYVIVHELVHLLEPTHNDRFISILDDYYPSWREARAELNELPLAAQVWKE